MVRCSERITTRFLGYERADTALGTVLLAVCALGVLLACSFAFAPTRLHGAFTDAATVARGLRTQAGGDAGALFAVVLGAGSVLGASAVTLATSYAVGDHFGLLPSATVFLLLLCNDREVLGPLVLAVTGLVLAVTGLAVGTAVLAAGATLIAIRARPVAAPSPADRRTWTMPHIESLRPPGPFGLARSAWSSCAATCSPRSSPWPCGPSSWRWARARPPDRTVARFPRARNHGPFC